MFKYVLFLTYLFLSLRVANCLETRPFLLSQLSKSQFSVDIEGKKRPLLFDEATQKYGVEYKGAFSFSEFGKPLKIKTSDHKKIQIEFYNKNYASIQIWDLQKLGNFDFSFLIARGDEIEKLHLDEINLNDESQELRPRSIFYQSGLTHIPTVKVFYLPTTRHYLKSTDEKEAEKYLFSYFNDLNSNIKNEYIVLKNFCLIKKEHSVDKIDCVGEALTTLLSRHLFKDNEQFSLYESCADQVNKRLNCVVQVLLKDETKEIPDFLYSKGEVESKLASMELNCTQGVELCLKKARQQLFHGLELNDLEKVTEKVVSHRKFNNDESAFFSDCYKAKFNVNDCLAETESQTFLRYLKNDLTQKTELLSIFEKEIKAQVSEGKHPTFQNVLVSGMEKILPEVNWEYEAVDIFKRALEPREAILKFKLIVANHFSSFPYEKSKRTPSSFCGVRRGELEKDLSEFLEHCR